MTSVAFMLGVLPLAVATGAGAEMRQALGVAVLGGMMGVTAFGIGLTPVFFVLVDRITHSAVAQHPWVTAVSEAILYTLALKFVRPVAATIRKATATGIRKATRNRFGA
jgi:multidrug efflux pump